VTLRIATPEQESLELADLHSQCPFPVSGNLLREMLRRSNPSLITIALRQVREQFNAALCAWSPTLCKRMVIRAWKKVCGNSQPLTVGAGSNLPLRVAKEPMRLSKKEAANLLHISLSTLERRIKAGKYTCTRTGEGQYSPLMFTYADIGLTEPAPAPVAPLDLFPAPPVMPEPEPAETRAVQCSGFQTDGSFVAPNGQVFKRDEGSPDYYDTGRTVLIEQHCDATPDGKRLFSRDGWEYQRDGQGKLYRTGARRLVGRLEMTSPNASDSVIRHPWSIEPSKAPQEQLGAKAIWEIHKIR